MTLTATTFNKDHYGVFEHLDWPENTNHSDHPIRRLCRKQHLLFKWSDWFWTGKHLPRTTNISLPRMRRRGMQMRTAGVGFDNDWITSRDEQSTFLIPLFPAWPDNDYDKDTATTITNNARTSTMAKITVSATSTNISKELSASVKIYHRRWI